MMPKRVLLVLPPPLYKEVLYLFCTSYDILEVLFLVRVEFSLGFSFETWFQESHQAP